MAGRKRRATLVASTAGVLALFGWVLYLANARSDPATRLVSEGPRPVMSVHDSPPVQPRYPDVAEREPGYLVDVPDGPGLLLRVRSSSGRPVDSIRVTDERTGEIVASAATDDDLLIPCGSHLDDLLIEAPDHAPHVVPVADVQAHVDRGEILECTLTRTYTLGGTAVWQDGRACPPGVTVLAWPASRPPDLAEVLRAASSTDVADVADVAGGELGADRAESTDQQLDLLVTTTDSDGSFVFPDPVPDGRYMITLGGRGIAADRRIVATPTRQTRYRIDIQSVYGLGVQLITPEGEYLPGLRTMRSATPSFGFQADGVAGVTLRSPSTIERCLLDPLLAEPEAHGIHYVMLMATSQYQQVGPMHVWARYPSCTMVTADLFIPTLANGLELTTITLEPSGLPTGSLEIQVIGWADAVQGVNQESLVLSLKLRPLSDDGPEILETAVLNGTWFEGDSLTVSGIPHGEYSVELDFSPLKAKLSQTATISDEPAHLAFSLDGLEAGSILIHVNDRLGRPFRGRAEFDLLSSDGRYASGHYFSSAPYLIPVVGPGRYQVQMLEAYAAEDDYPSARSATFEVERGEQELVLLTFERME